MNKNHNENRGVHSKLFTYCTGTGHYPSTGHSYIKATHHEWNNSKEERFPLWLPMTPLCVWMRCCKHLKSVNSNGDSPTTTCTRIDLHCYGTFNTLWKWWRHLVTKSCLHGMLVPNTGCKQTMASNSGGPLTFFGVHTFFPFPGLIFIEITRSPLKNHQRSFSMKFGS